MVFKLERGLFLLSRDTDYGERWNLFCAQFLLLIAFNFRLGSRLLFPTMEMYSANKRENKRTTTSNIYSFGSFYRAFLGLLGWFSHLGSHRMFVNFAFTSFTPKAWMKGGDAAQNSPKFQVSQWLNLVSFKRIASAMLPILWGFSGFFHVKKIR